MANVIRRLFDQRMGHITSSFKEAQRRDPVFDNIHECFEVLRGVSYVAGLKDFADTHRDVVSPLVIDNIDRALSINFLMWLMHFIRRPFWQKPGCRFLMMLTL